MYWYFSVTVINEENMWHNYFIPKGFSSINEFLELFHKAPTAIKETKIGKIDIVHTCLLVLIKNRLNMSAEEFTTNLGLIQGILFFLVHRKLQKEESDRFSIMAYRSIHPEEIFFAFSGARMRRVSKHECRLFRQYCTICSNPNCRNYGTEKCGGCMASYYCSTTCQRAHWKTHRPMCKHIQAISPTQICESIHEFILDKWIRID